MLLVMLTEPHTWLFEKVTPPVLLVMITDPKMALPLLAQAAPPPMLMGPVVPVMVGPPDSGKLEVIPNVKAAYPTLSPDRSAVPPEFHTWRGCEACGFRFW